MSYRDFRSVLLVAISVATLMLCSTASADVFHLNLGSLPSGNQPNTVNNVSSIDLDGNNNRSWGNAFIGAGGQPMVRVIGITVFQQYDRQSAAEPPNANLPPEGNVSYNGQNLTAVFTLEGNLAQPNANQVNVTFTSGTVGIFLSNQGGTDKLVPNEPLTWGAVTSGMGGFTLNTPLALFTLKPQENVVDDLYLTDTGTLAGNSVANGMPTTILNASQTNVSFLTTGSGSKTNAILLFQETASAHGINSVLGTTFLEVGAGDPDGFMSVTRGSVNTGNDVTVDTGDLSVFNFIFATLGGYGDLIAAPGTAWATGLGGASFTDYSPGTVGLNAAADLATAFDTVPVNNPDNPRAYGLRPGYQMADTTNGTPEVPEPASLFCWLAGASGVLAYRRLRRRQAVAA